MASLNKRPGYEANLPRTAHDLSRQLHFTSTVGPIIPVYHHPLSPSDHIELEAFQFIRSLYLNTASLAQIDFKIDAFFVPMTMLYTPFENIFYGTKDFTSYAAGLNVATNDVDGHFPMLNFNETFSAPDLNTFVQQYPKYRELYRLLMHLGYNPNIIWYKIASSEYGGVGTEVTPCYYNVCQPNVFPYAYLAYNAIYYKYYRLDEYTPDNVQMYNIDDAVSNSVVVAPRFKLNYGCHYIPRYMDYFTRVKRSPLASSVGQIYESGLYSLEYLTKVNNYLGSSNTHLLTSSETAYTQNIYNTQLGSEYIGDYPLNTSGARTMFAVEKLMRIYGRAKKNYDEQILAHFGWKVPHDVKHQLTYLGSFGSSLEIQQITATADTSTAALGSITGTGASKMQGKKIKFTAPVHGVLMLVAYSRPKTPYEVPFNKINSIATRLDFPQPEFDHLGMQPLYRYEAEKEGLLTSHRSEFLGWQYRYEQFKSKFDEYTVAFADPSHNPVGDDYHSNNAFQTWIVGRRPFNIEEFDQDNPLTFEDFSVDGHFIDQIMAVPFSDNGSAEYLMAPWLMFQTDPFIHWLDVHCTLTSFMSKYGEPELD